MSEISTENWAEWNQRALLAELARVRSLLARRAIRDEAGAREDSSEEAFAGEPEIRKAGAEMAAPTALQNLCSIFSLSAFERDVLLLCAGIELDSAFAGHCAGASGDLRKMYPTFSLALATLPEPHWSALLPCASLRRWRLIELSDTESITTSALRIDERILHYLTGLSYLDERLRGHFELVACDGEL